MKQTKQSYLQNKLKEVEFNKKALYNKKAYKEYVKETGSKTNWDGYVNGVQRAFVSLSNILEEDDVISDSLVKTQAGKQKLQDKNNVINKSIREQNRLYNHLEELYSGYVNIMREVNDIDSFKIKKEIINNSNSSDWGIIQITDTHANKLIKPGENLDNIYDFYVFSQRLKFFITKCINQLNFEKRKNVCVIFTGDLLTSDFRENQKMTRITNQIKGSLLTSHIFKQMLIELSQTFNKVKVISVCGNESRLSEFVYSDEVLATNNYDFLIHNNLRLWLDNFNNIEFIKDGNFIERLVTLDGFNFIMLHGNTLKGKDTDRQLKEIITHYALKGIKIHAIFSGHIHSSCIGDIFSRSSSMIGEDNYSRKDLHCLSRSSHNLYLPNKDNSYNAIKYDIQNCSQVKGYEIKEELEAYYIDTNIKPNTEVIIRNLV